MEDDGAMRIIREMIRLASLQSARAEEILREHHERLKEPKPTVSFPEMMVTRCSKCGEICLKVCASSLCQDCIDWPSVVLEDVLDEEVIYAES